MTRTSGTVGEDPADGITPPAMRSMLDASSLAIDFNTTWYRDDGTWRVYERGAGRYLGLMTIDHGGSFRQAACAAFDADGRPMFSARQRRRMGVLSLLVQDHQGQPVGRIVRSSMISLQAPNSGSGIP